ncbi:MAG: FUSC family protein [Actinobacteria bacterium]|nr:FUSC family protein [Actinomycetota bacterium]MCA1740081.1 FUSC family protein [Actinomycetota bacterium]
MTTNEGLSWREKVWFFLRLRQRLRSGAGRLRDGWFQILQTAVAAGVAWLLTYLILGRWQPEFAPIAAVISLGLAAGQRGRRAVELTLGVAFGVAIADLLVSFIGVGPVQGAVIVALAMAATVFFGRGELGVNEAAISAMILMITFQSSGAGFPPDRFLEALIGGGTALLVNALLPINPELMVERAVHPIFNESVAVLEETAAALDDGDLERAERALAKARAIDARVSGFKEALEAGHETARFAPPRRRALRHLDLYAAAADQIDLTVRNVRGLARAALSVVHSGNPAPGPLPVALRDLARATEALAAYLETLDEPEDARRFALQAARSATTLLKEREDLATDLATNAFVDQILSATVDLLGGTGMDRAAALQAIDEVQNSDSEPE